MSLEQRVQAALAAHPEDKKLRLLASGYQDAWKACASERTAANLKALETWEGKLQGYLDGLPEATGQEARHLPDPLRNYNQVRQYIIQLGYGCSASQPKRDEERGLLRRRKGQGFTKAEVRRYALSKYGPVVRDGQALDAPATPLEQDKSLAEELMREKIRNQRIAADKAELAMQKERGTLVPAADQAIMLATFGAVLESELKNIIRQIAPKLIKTVQGDPSRKQQAVRMCFEAVDTALRRAAETEEYRVKFESLGGAEQTEAVNQ